MRPKCLVVSAVAFGLLALLPAPVLAQSAIAGVVRDTSGAVLPGVVVEASSPVLIEKMRSVVTDGEGAYRVVDLRPGLYAVTFSLPGFTSVKRDEIALPAAFTATVNVVLSVGALEETVSCLGGCAARRRSERVVRAAAFRRTARSSSSLAIPAGLRGAHARDCQRRYQYYRRRSRRNESLEPRFAHPGIALSDRRT